MGALDISDKAREAHNIAQPQSPVNCLNVVLGWFTGGGMAGIGAEVPIRNHEVRNLMDKMPAKLLQLQRGLLANTCYSNMAEMFGPVEFIRQADFPPH